MSVSQYYDFDLAGYLFRGGDPTVYARLQSVSGLDNPETNMVTVGKAGSHGAYVRGQFTKERTVTLTGTIRTDDPTIVAGELARLRNAFAPVADDVKLSFWLPGMPVQFLNVKPASLHYDIDSDATTVGVVDFVGTLVAGDPRIYSASSYVVPMSPGSQDGGLHFPVSFPLGFSVGGTSGITTVQQQGSTRAPAKIRFIGPLTNPAVTNSTTGDSFALKMSVLAGDEVAVDSLNRTVLYRPAGTPSGGTTRYSAVVPGSKFLDVAGAFSTADSLTVRADAGSGSIEITYSDTWL